MSRPLTSVLLVEGTSDADFFQVLVERVLRDLGHSNPGPDFEVAEPIVLHRRGDRPFHAFADEVLAMQPLPALAFCHYDEARNLERGESQAWAPMVAAWAANNPSDDRIRLVPLAPVREMESWALADLDVICTLARCDIRRPDVFESDLLDQVERLTDPKRTLQKALRVGTKGRRTSMSSDDTFSLLAERIRLDRLGRVPSFRTWRDKTEDALRELNFIRGPGGSRR